MLPEEMVHQDCNVLFPGPEGNSLAGLSGQLSPIAAAGGSSRASLTFFPDDLQARCQYLTVSAGRPLHALLDVAAAGFLESEDSNGATLEATPGARDRHKHRDPITGLTDSWQRTGDPELLPRQGSTGQGRSGRFSRDASDAGTQPAERSLSHREAQSLSGRSSTPSSLPAFLATSEESRPRRAEKTRTESQVIVRAVDSTASETSPAQASDFGAFRIVRKGDTRKALKVNCAWGGQAEQGRDYLSPVTSLTFKPGQTSLAIEIAPLSDRVREASEDVTLTLLPGRRYTRGLSFTDAVTIKDVDPAKLAVSLWRRHQNPILVCRSLRRSGFRSEEIAAIFSDHLKAASIADLAKGLWDQGDAIAPVDLVRLLRKQQATPSRIALALEQVGLNAEQIVDGLRLGLSSPSGRPLPFLAIAKTTQQLPSLRSAGQLAKALWNAGATPTEVARSLDGIGRSTAQIARALFGGITKPNGERLAYSEIAEALYHSQVEPVAAGVLVDQLWALGASAEQIGQSMDLLGFDLGSLIRAVRAGSGGEGSPPRSFSTAALAAWNSGDGLDTRQLVGLLADAGATPSEIGPAIQAIGFGAGVIADAIDDGPVDFAYSDVAQALWNSGLGLDARELAGLLWNEGATQAEIGQAMGALGLGLEVIADAMDDGLVDFNYIDVTLALWNSGLALDTRVLAGLLWNEGAAQADLGQAIQYLGFGLTIIADAMAAGPIDFNAIDVGLALWNSGLNPDARQVTGALWDSGFTQQDIGQALAHLGYGLSGIADALDDGPVDFNYSDVALALWNSGLSLDTRILAGVLWNEGAIQGDIGNAIRVLGYGLETIADAIDDGPIDFNYIDVTLALWNSGLSLDTRDLAGLLWNEGATQEAIGQAIKFLGFDLATIADAMDEGPIDFNFIDVALALWNSGHDFDTRVLAELLWNEGASQEEIGQAFRFLGHGLDLIADAMANGPIAFNEIDIGLALWNSGYAVSGSQIASVLWNVGFDQGEIGQSLRSLGFNAGQVGYAIYHAPGIGFNYVDVARGVWDSGLSVSDQDIADIVSSLGGGVGDVFDAVMEIGAGRLRAIFLSTRAFFIGVADGVQDIGDFIAQEAENLVDEIKTVIPEEIVDITLLPITIPTAIVNSVVEAIQSGDIGAIADGLKRIPVLGTAVGVIEGVVNAINGDEKEVLISAIDSALAFYGGSNIITPAMVEFIVDIFWALKDDDYQGAIAATLENLGINRRVADVFVSVSWAAALDPDWKTVIKAGLSRVGFPNAEDLINIAWSLIEDDVTAVLKGAMNYLGADQLNLDRKKINLIAELAMAIQDNNPGKIANLLVAYSGGNEMLALANRLRDDLPANDRLAVQQALELIGVAQAADWMEVIWAVKENDLPKALTTMLRIGDFARGNEWVAIITHLNNGDYAAALGLAFDLAGFEDGVSLAHAFEAVRNSDFFRAFQESLNLVEDGGKDLARAFEDLRNSDIAGFVQSIVKASPLLLRLAI